MSIARIIISAYGPATVTKRAVARARKLVSTDGEVIVVPATAAGVDGRKRLEGAGSVVVVDGYARAALTRGLSRCPDGPVLFVHDDALVTHEALEAMLAAHAATRRTVCPWTNDVQVDHFVGELPPVIQALPAVRAAMRTSGARRRHTVAVRPSCLLGDVESLRALVPHHLAAAGSIIRNPDEPFVVADGAVVAHDGKCTARLLSSVGPQGRPLLVASMIMRDEETMIGDCLASLSGLVDRVEVVDTGSQDRSVEIAEAAGAHVLHRTWREDFAWARNEALERCRDAWYVLQIDADERVVCDDPVMIRRRLATAVGEHDAFNLEISNLDDGTDAASSVFSTTRIVRPDGMHWVGALHEQLRPLPGSAELRAAPAHLVGLSLDHLGYRRDVVGRKDKGRRNLDIARAAYVAERSPGATLNYARTLSATGIDPTLEAELYEEAMARLDSFSRDWQAMILGEVARHCLRRNETDAAYELSRQALELVPADDGAATVFAQSALRLNRPEDAAAMFERRRTVPSVPPAFVSQATWTGARSQEVSTLVAIGDVDRAYEVARETLAERSNGFAAWTELIGGLRMRHEAAAPTLVLELLLSDRQLESMGIVVQWFPPAEVAELCRDYVRRGGSHAEAVRVGLTAAVLSGRQDLVEDFSAQVSRLDAETVQRIAQRAEARGRVEAAETIRRSGPFAQLTR